VRGPRSGFDDALFARLASRPEVAAASPWWRSPPRLQPAAERFACIGVDPMRAAAMQPAFLAAQHLTGRSHAGGLLDESAVWLSPRAAARLKLAAGGKLVLAAGTGSAEFEVGGVLPMLDAETAVIDIAAAQSRFDRVGRLSRIELRLKPGVDEARWRDEITPLLPPGRHGLARRVVRGPRGGDHARLPREPRRARARCPGHGRLPRVLDARACRPHAAARSWRRCARWASPAAASRCCSRPRAPQSAPWVRPSAPHSGSPPAACCWPRWAPTSARAISPDMPEPSRPTLGHSQAIALLAIAMAVGAALWVARAVDRVPVAVALRDRAIDLEQDPRRSMAIAIGFAIVGVPFLFMPAVDGLPLGGYAAIALWLCRRGCRRGARLPGAPRPHARLDTGGRAGARPGAAPPGHLAASVAGIVVSASLCVAMAIMVHSFRVSFEQWLRASWAPTSTCARPRKEIRAS
jgi:putative ABC transport system permease protein